MFLQFLLSDLNQAASQPRVVSPTLGKTDPVHQTVTRLQGHLTSESKRVDIRFYHVGLNVQLVYQIIYSNSSSIIYSASVS